VVREGRRGGGEDGEVSGGLEVGCVERGGREEGERVLRVMPDLSGSGRAACSGSRSWCWGWGLWIVRATVGGIELFESETACWECCLLDVSLPLRAFVLYEHSDERYWCRSVPFDRFARQCVGWWGGGKLGRRCAGIASKSTIFSSMAL